jgi:aspartyl-tRNA(Asn)/glutamyl-tRNA(Gln) amidotransferase subunit C
MALITKEEVLKIAHMSRIAIHENEIDTLIKQLEAVLAYAARVNEVAVGQQAPLPQNSNVFREDIIIPCDAARIKKEGPDVEADYFVVPAILEHE